MAFFAGMQRFLHAPTLSTTPPPGSRQHPAGCENALTLLSVCMQGPRPGAVIPRPRSLPRRIHHEMHRRGCGNHRSRLGRHERLQGRSHPYEQAGRDRGWPLRHHLRAGRLHAEQTADRRGGLRPCHRQRAPLRHPRRGPARWMGRPSWSGSVANATASWASCSIRWSAGRKRTTQGAGALHRTRRALRQRRGPRQRGAHHHRHRCPAERSRWLAGPPG